MTALRLDQVREILPPLDELRPVLDRLIASSEPDASRTWTRSGELDTLGGRMVSGETVAEAAREMAQAEAAHLEEVYRAVGAALRSLEEGDAGEACRRLLEAARLEEARERPDRAEAYARSAWQTARDERDRQPAALALRRWARASRARGDLDGSLRRYRESHAISEAVFDGRGAAEAAIGAGNVLEQQGRWEEAEGWYRRALEALDDLEEEGRAVPERWHALLNLHIALRFRGDLEESLPLLDEAARVAEDMGDPSALPFLENARGQLHVRAGAYQRAERHFRAALRSAPGSHAAVTIRLNLAEALLADGRTLDAAEEARLAEREALGGAVVGKLPEVYRLLGRIADHAGNPDAFVLFERALELVRERGLPTLEEALTLQAYAEFEARQGDDQTARNLHEKARAMYDALDITHMRHPWTDYFGPGAEAPHDSPPDPTDERDD